MIFSNRVLIDYYRVNFKKYEKTNLPNYDYLMNSSVYKMIHKMEREPKKGIPVRPAKVNAAEDIIERVVSFSLQPFTIVHINRLEKMMVMIKLIVNRQLKNSLLNILKQNCIILYYILVNNKRHLTWNLKLTLS